jgi:hypothetical protein
MKKHWLTTLFGFLLALGTAMTQAPGIKENPTAQGVGGIVSTLSALALGAAAADARKNNNGKDTPRSDAR